MRALRRAGSTTALVASPVGKSSGGPCSALTTDGSMPSILPAGGATGSSPHSKTAYLCFDKLCMPFVLPAAGAHRIFSLERGPISALTHDACMHAFYAAGRRDPPDLLLGVEVEGRGLGLGADVVDAQAVAVHVAIRALVDTHTLQGRRGKAEGAGVRSVSTAWRAADAQGARV